MFAEELLSNDIFPLKKTDSCESALVFMSDWKVFHLPVVDNGKLLGYVSYDDIINHWFNYTPTKASIFLK
jgi:predicted transcriptional regulator